jgi:hypothetical protein
MENNKDQSLRLKWKYFINILFDPWIISLLLLVFILLYSSNNVADKNIQSFMTIVISVVSSLLGGIVAHRWAEKTELKVLITRGSSAIRSLKLISFNINKISDRTKVYIQSLDQDNKEYKHVFSNYQEMIEKCNILAEEVISSIENWTDIIPEVENVKSQIGNISDKIVEGDSIAKELGILKIKLSESQDQLSEGSKENEELKISISEKENELIKIRKELRVAENKYNTSILSGLRGPTGSISGSVLEWENSFAATGPGLGHSRSIFDPRLLSEDPTIDFRSTGISSPSNPLVSNIYKEPIATTKLTEPITERDDLTRTTHINSPDFKESTKPKT